MKGSRARGRIPLVCVECKASRPGESWCTHHREWHDVSSFAPRGKSGAPRAECKDASAEKRRVGVTRVCPNCRKGQPLDRFKDHPGQSGTGRNVCNPCAERYPNHAWCATHRALHPRGEFFSDSSRRNGLEASCADSRGDDSWKRLSGELITCPSCGDACPSTAFRGGRRKSATCSSCETRNPLHRWCVEHEQWMPESEFGISRSPSSERKVSPSRCRPCHTAHLHGTTTERLLALNGSSIPECAVCGSPDGLQVDHDHSHCPGPKGCAECVRGYLCRACNTAEAQLKTAGNAQRLVEYMARHSRA